MNSSIFRDAFPITAEYSYLSHASVSPLNRRAAVAMEEFIRRAQTTPPEQLFEDLVSTEQAGKALLAEYINAARADEIVAVPNTAVGLNTAAQSLPLKPGDNVLVVDDDYPSVIYPWMNLAPQGVLTKVVPLVNGGVDLDVLAARIDAHTRAICLSTVMFATGYRNDIEAIGTLCHERGIFFVVDGIQSLGAFRLDVQACHIDFLACGSHKWMLGPIGSGFMYCRHELLDQLQLGAYVGATSVVDPLNYLDYNFTLLPSSERFDIGAANVAGILGMFASLQLIREAGYEEVAMRVLALAGRAIEDLQGRGYRVLAPNEPTHRSGIVIVDVDDAEAAQQKLLAGGVVTSVRGGRLRLSPHFYNTDEDVCRVGDLLGNR